MIEVKINVYTPAECRAFAKFLSDVAEARESEYAAKEAQYRDMVANGTVLGGLNQPTVIGAVVAQNAAAAQAVSADLQNAAVSEAAPAGDKPKRTRKPKEDKAEVPAFLKDVQKESAETQAQDEADEAAESEAAKEEQVAAEPAKLLTHDNVREVLGFYVKKFGLEACQADGPKLIGKLFGEGKVKVSDIPDDQESLAKAVAGAREMLEKNPFQRAAVANA